LSTLRLVPIRKHALSTAQSDASYMLSHRRRTSTVAAAVAAE